MKDSIVKILATTLGVIICWILLADFVLFIAWCFGLAITFRVAVGCVGLMVWLYIMVNMLRR